MKVVREWLKVHCDGDVLDYEKMKGFGNEGYNYFKMVEAGHMADFVVRLRKGSSMELKILRETQHASLFVSWPPSSEQPLHVALGIGQR